MYFQRLSKVLFLDRDFQISLSESYEIIKKSIKKLSRLLYTLFSTHLKVSFGTFSNLIKRVKTGSWTLVRVVDIFRWILYRKKIKNLLWPSKARCQFHQCFSNAFFVRKCFFCQKVTRENHFCAKNSHVKCWWNWLQGGANGSVAPCFSRN